MVWGEEEEAESKATGALSWTWLGSPEQCCCLRGVWSWQHFHGLCFLQDLPLLSWAGRFPYLLLRLRVAGGAWPCVLAWLFSHALQWAEQRCYRVGQVEN